MRAFIHPETQAEDWANRQARIARRQRLSARTGKWIAGPVLTALGGLHVIGDEVFDDIEGPVIVASDHFSQVDILALGVAHAMSTKRQKRYPRFIAKDKLQLPILGSYIEHRGTIFIERGIGLEAQDGGAEVDQALEDDEDIVTFVPGTRHPGEVLRRIDVKKGIARLGLKHGVPIIPAYPENTGWTARHPVVVYRPAIIVPKIELADKSVSPEDGVRKREWRRLRTQITDTVFQEIMTAKEIAEEASHYLSERRRYGRRRYLR